MIPEAERYLTKARLTLERARQMLTVNLTEDAGRSAYLASYQAAEAFVFERTLWAVLLPCLIKAHHEVPALNTR